MIHLTFRFLIISFTLAAAATESGLAQQRPPMRLPPGAGAVASLPPVGRPLRPYRFDRLVGGALSPQDLEAQPVVFLLWATTCSGAQQIVAQVDSARRDAQAKGIRLFLVALDTNRAAVAAALAGRVADDAVLFGTNARNVFTDSAFIAMWEPGTPIATIVPSFVGLDSLGTVRASRPWDAHPDTLRAVFAVVGVQGPSQRRP